MTHTPTPWKVSDRHFVNDNVTRYFIFQNTGHPDYQELAILAKKEDADFVVRVVNCHDELVEALKNITNLPNELCCPSVKNFAKEALAKAEEL